MRWSDGRRSDNVDDRRGRPGPGMAAGGIGLGGLLLAVVAGLLGGTGGTAGGVGLLKLLILLGGSWGLFRAGLAEALPFAVGFGALPLGITLSPLFLGASSPEKTTSSSPGAGGSR